MEQQTLSNVMRMSEKLFDEFEEKAVDLDFVLPDYCPDIAAILKCTVTPTVTAEKWSADRFMVDGVVTIRVLYLDETRTVVHAYEVTQNYSVSFRVNVNCDHVHHFLSTETEYVNCRATGPRRVDVHGAFRVCLRVVGEGTKRIYADPFDNRIFCNTKEICCSVPTGETVKSLTVGETISLGESAEELVYATAVAVVHDTKKLLNKLIVKGILHLKALLIFDRENGVMKPITQEIPFSQIVDVDGMNEDTLCGVQAICGELHVHLQQDESDNAALSVSCKIDLFVRCACTEQVQVVLDAYHTCHPMACETMTMHICCELPCDAQRLRVRQSTALPDGVCEVIDLWGEAKLISQKYENGKQKAEVCLLLGLLGRDEDGHIGCYERTVDCTPELNGDPRVKVESLRLICLSGKCVGSRLEIDVELEAVCCDVNEQTLSVVSDVAINEQEQFPTSNAALRIVYAGEGESAWNIAKAAHASVEKMMAENDLSEEILTKPTMLLIPMD